MEARLTASPKLRIRCTIVPSFPRNGALLGPDEPLIKGPPSNAPSSPASSAGERVVTPPLTLSVAPPLSGLQDLTPHLNEKAPGPPSPAAPSKATRFTDPERLTIEGEPGKARLRDALPSAATDFCNLCDPRAQPQIA